MGEEVSSTLSRKQREWLRGSDTAFDSPDRVVRSRIRKRVRQSFKDIALLHRSDRFPSEEMMKTLRQNTTSSNDALSHKGHIEEHLIADSLDTAFSHFETVSGERAEDLSDVSEELHKEIKNHSKGLIDNQWYPVFAVFGAYIALRGAGMNEKQAQLWVTNNWPVQDDVDGLLERGKEAGGL